MLTCQQTETQNIFQHGLSVWKYYQELLAQLSQKNIHPDWRIPEELFEIDLAELHPEDISRNYLIYHDCGKPFCLYIDEQGRRHFPKHAQESKEIFFKISDLDLSTVKKAQIADLISWDMIFHTATAKKITDYLKNTWSKKDALTLLLASFSEIHSNASMFGGVNSVSFKTKYRRLKRRMKQTLKFYKERKNDL